jgi:hypothetical protein
MTSRFSQIGLVGLVAVVIAGVAGSATAKPVPSGYPRQAQVADGLRWQAIAGAYQQMRDRPASSFYTHAALRAMGLRWQGVAQVYGMHRTAASTSVGTTNDEGFDWGSAFVGALTVFGLGTVGVLLAVGARRVRRAKVAV